MIREKERERGHRGVVDGGDRVQYGVEPVQAHTHRGHEVCRMMWYMERHNMRVRVRRGAATATVRGHGARPIWRQRQRCPWVARREDIIVSTPLAGHVTSPFAAWHSVAWVREALGMHLESAAAVTRDGGDTRRWRHATTRSTRGTRCPRAATLRRHHTHQQDRRCEKKVHSQCTRGSRV